MASLARGKKVLIVDCWPVIAFSLAEIFRQDGYETRSVRDAEAALKLLDTWHPDLAILEMILLDMNGFDCATRIKTILPGCSILLYSGQVSEHLIEAARECGFPFFRKPVYPRVLLDAVESLLFAPGQA